MFSYLFHFTSVIVICLIFKLWLVKLTWGLKLLWKIWWEDLILFWLTMILIEKHFQFDSTSSMDPHTYPCCLYQLTSHRFWTFYQGDFFAFWNCSHLLIWVVHFISITVHTFLLIKKILFPLILCAWLDCDSFECLVR